MKYGIRIHEGQAKANEKNKERIINIGDLFMCLAVKRIYEKMEIPKDEIVEIQTYDFEDYDGEYIVLPMNFYESYLRISPRILPTFLALSLEWEQEWSEKEINMLRRFSPIGCRDERTMRELHKLGIDAYFNGCLVGTFPKRETNLDTQKKVFIIDAHECIKKVMPDSLKQEAVYFPHEYFKTLPDFLGEYDNIFDFAQSVIDMYAKEAKMIITSRFHGAVIALALGIPVILIMDNDYYKYSWIKKYIPIYVPADVEKIDWNPEPKCISDEEKELMIKVAQKRLRDTYEKYHDICTLSEYKEDLTQKEFDDLFYGEEAINYIKNNWETDTDKEYVFWGVTHTAFKIQEFISNNYPNAKLCNVYDMIVRNKFLGFIPEAPELIRKKEKRFIFVTADSANSAARKMFAEMGRDESEFFCCQRKNDLDK